MNTKLSCDIVQDLLPSYIDSLTSEATNEAVNEHLKECPKCSEALKRMKEPEKTDTEPKAQVNYLKKVRRRSLQKGAVICAALIILVLSLNWLRVLYFGKEADTGSFLSAVQVTDNTVKVYGEFTEGAAARTAFSEKDGTVEITVYGAPKSFINKETFSREYEGKDTVKKVKVNGLVKWENGAPVSEAAAELYSLKTPYIGSMPACSKIAGALGIGNHLGDYLNELHTAQEPYGWTLLFENGFAPYREKDVQKIMFRDSCVLIALIGNLDYVTWEYPAKGDMVKYTVTAKDASEFTGRNIKDYSLSASEVQSLLDLLGINQNGKRELMRTDSFYMNIENRSGKEIKEYTMDCYLNGEIVGAFLPMDANNPNAPKDGSVRFMFTSSCFPLRTQNYELQSFSFDLKAVDADGREYILCKDKEFPVQYNYSYYFAVENSENGPVLIEK